MRFNIGSGGTLLPDYMNVDITRPANYVEGRDQFYQMDLDKDHMPAEWHGKATHIYMSHVLEHLRNPLFVMEELWKIASTGCVLEIRVPYGSSDNAWEDPTHVRPYFIGSWAYFSQIYYAKVDYGYRGDWEAENIIVEVYADKCDSNEGERVIEEIKMKRNMVREMTALLRPVKPIRDPKLLVGIDLKHRITLNFV